MALTFERNPDVAHTRNLCIAPRRFHSVLWLHDPATVFTNLLNDCLKKHTIVPGVKKGPHLYQLSVQRTAVSASTH